MFAKLVSSHQRISRLFIAGLIAFAMQGFSSSLIQGQSPSRNEIRGVATFVDGTYGRQFQEDSRIAGPVKFEYGNNTDVLHGLRITTSLYHRRFPHVVSRTAYTQAAFTGVKMKTGSITTINSFPGDWLIMTTDVHIDPAFQGEFQEESSIPGGSRLLLLVRRGRDLNDDGLDYVLPEFDAELPKVIARFRATLCNRALNDIGQEPWRSELELSDAQINKVYAESSRWYAENGNEIVKKLAGNQNEDETNLLWQLWHHDQWEIASEILVPHQQQRLIHLHNQSELNLDSIQEGTSFWLANPTLWEELDLADKQREKLRTLDEQLQKELAERRREIDKKMESVDEGFQRQLLKLLMEPERIVVEQIIGDPLEFDDEEWIAATKQARANYRQERAVKTFMGDHKYGGGGDGYMYKSGEVSTQLNLPTYGIVTKFEPELIRTLTRLEFVRKDLELSRDQMVQLERSISEFQEMWKKHIKDRGSPDFASRNAKFKIEIENNEMGLQAIFDEKQRARVFQILNQMSHRAFSHQPVLTHPAWPSSLKLSKERTAKFREEVESVKTARAKIIEEQEKSLGKIYARFEKKMKSEFDESDRKKMDELLGDPVFLPTWEDRTNSDAEKAGTEDADKR